MWRRNTHWFTFILPLLLATIVVDGTCDEPDRFAAQIRPLLHKYCIECHSDSTTEADIDLSAFAVTEDVRRNTAVWQRVREILASGQMPPRDSKQPSEEHLRLMNSWVQEVLASEALVNAGDPGPVILRRLSNAEYTYTIRDLTGITSLAPTAEFPVDGAAGEGFTNTGSGLVMSTSLVEKYFAAAKAVSRHAAFFPDEVRFTPHLSRRDLTDSLLQQIQSFYRRYANVSLDGTVELFGGTPFQSGEAGVLPLGNYILATIEEREDLLSGQTTVAQVARQRNLSAVYLQRLWQILSSSEQQESFLLEELRRSWQNTDASTVKNLIAQIEARRSRLWKFNVVGHLGREGAATSWMEPATLTTERREFRIPVSAKEDGDSTVVYLVAGDAADHSTDHDFVLWRDLRLEAPGQPAIPLRLAQSYSKQSNALKHDFIHKAKDYLDAVSKLEKTSDIEEIARQAGLNPDLLREWATLASPDGAGQVQVSGHFSNRIPNTQNYDFISGWGSPATPSVIANSSDDSVRIPGLARPHSVVVHPAPTEYVSVDWQSPVSGSIIIDADIADAHPECGNGVEWFLLHRRGKTSSTIWSGQINVAGSARMNPTEVAVGTGDVISFRVGPRDGNHSCDLTAVNISLTSRTDSNQTWTLSQDVTPNILDSNPRPDRFGNSAIWHFCHGPMSDISGNNKPGPLVPPQSVLAEWIRNKEDRHALTDRLVTLLQQTKLTAEQEGTPDGQLYEQLRRIEFPASVVLKQTLAPDDRFGTHPLGHKIDPDHIVVKAPKVLEFHIPRVLTNGYELVGAGMYDPGHGTEGTTQVHIGPDPNLPAEAPVICKSGTTSHKRIEKEVDLYRHLFPSALCYYRIVPIDEVVTASLFHREDDLFKELMLTRKEAKELDKLWDELRYVSQEPLELVVALEQIREFATQDRADLVGPFDRMKQEATQRANRFQQQLLASEPSHLESVLKFTSLAWRRPLTPQEKQKLIELYQSLREQTLSHQEAIRLMVARTLTSPAFLYKRERPGQSDTRFVTDHEMAVRLSYFLWSSAPDRELRALANQDALQQAEELLRQSRRMIRDPRIRRMAIQFFCQWLHLRDFDQNDNKNEALFPEFESLRRAMYEETILFVEDIIRNDRPLTDLLKSDATFLDEKLATHYGINGVLGEHFRRVPTSVKTGRGGILTMAAFLSSQSGASRSSPVLRGAWISETLLGERLPRPPANVPQLPELVPPGLTSRQLIERHSQAPACAKCHARIDPYGFTLEQYDAVGRQRKSPVDTSATLADGTELENVQSLKDYLSTVRRDDFLRQFCRKLLGYALGREIMLSDEPLLNEMLAALKNRELRFSAALECVILSKQFRSIRGRDHQSLKSSPGGDTP